MFENDIDDIVKFLKSQMTENDYSRCFLQEKPLEEKNSSDNSSDKEIGMRQTSSFLNRERRQTNIFDEEVDKNVHHAKKLMKSIFFDKNNENLKVKTKRKN